MHVLWYKDARPQQACHCTHQCCLGILYWCGNFRISAAVSHLGSLVSCHACIDFSRALLRHNQVRAAMFDHVVVQHDGLSWTIGGRPPKERKCVL